MSKMHIESVNKTHRPLLYPHVSFPSWNHHQGVQLRQPLPVPGLVDSACIQGTLCGLASLADTSGVWVRERSCRGWGGVGPDLTAYAPQDLLET